MDDCTPCFLTAVARRVPRPKIEPGIYVPCGRYGNLKEKNLNNLVNNRVFSWAVIHFLQVLKLYTNLFRALRPKDFFTVFWHKKIINIFFSLEEKKRVTNVLHSTQNISDTELFKNSRGSFQFSLPHTC